MNSVARPTVGIKNFLLNRLKGDLQPTKASKTRIRIAISAFYFSMGLSFASWASRIADIKTGLRLTEAELGTVLLALPLGQLVTMPISGRLVTRYGSRTILSIAILLYVFQLTNIGWASSGWQLGIMLFLYGVVGNLSNISVNTQGVLAENLYGRSIMTSFHGVWSLAGITGALIGTLMINLALSPRIHFLAVAGLVLIIVFSTRKYLIPGTSASPQKKKFLSRPDPVLVQLGLIAFCSMAAEGAMFDWSGVYFREIVGAPSSLVLLGYISFMTMMAAGRFVGDRVIARIGRQQTIRFGGILITAGLLISVLFPALVTATIGFLIVGIGVSSIVPTVYSTAAKSAKVAPGMALATVSSISFLGFLVGPPVIGYIAHVSNLRFSFAAVALLGIAISIMVSRLKVMA